MRIYFFSKRILKLLSFALILPLTLFEINLINSPTKAEKKLIATSEKDYIVKAVNLASDTNKLAQIRSTLRTEMEASPIMDPKSFIYELENNYQAMWNKWCSS
mgnify:CR=1 FL=1